MLTTPERFAAMTNAQRYEALARAELQRDNAELLLRELSGRAAAERQQAAVAQLQGETKSVAA